VKTGLSFPTQMLTGNIGILCDGKYSLAEAISLGEGGIFFRNPNQQFIDGQPVVVTFGIPHFLNLKHELFSQRGQIALVDPVAKTTPGFQRLSGLTAKINKPKQLLIIFSEITPEFKKKVRSYLVSKDERIA
jgi:hypothetical protein